MDDLDRRMMAAWNLISQGKADAALVEARALLGHPDASHPTRRMSCAGLLIDAGDRLLDKEAVRDGIAILAKLVEAADFPAENRQGLLYNLANGKSAVLQMALRGREPDEDVRDLTVEDEIVSIYYDASAQLLAGPPEPVINCAVVLRIEGRVYEAMDLLDGVLRRNPGHPSAHQKMAEALWWAFWDSRRCDDRPEALLVAALVHYERAARGFDAAREPMFAASTREEAARLRADAEDVMQRRVGADIADIGDAVLSAGPRFGAPLGLGLLARSPYRDGDDPWLIENLRPDLRDMVVDAAGTFAVGRQLLLQALDPEVTMPSWGDYTPDAAVHIPNAGVRQLWSTLDKVAWLINDAFDVGIPEGERSFGALFWPRPKKGKPAPGLRPKLGRRNPGLRALAGLSQAFYGRPGVYAPLKRLRHGVEHRVPDNDTTQDDAAFLLGIARAAVLHAVDALVAEATASDRT